MPPIRPASDNPLSTSLARLTFAAFAALVLSFACTVYAWTVSSNFPGGTGWGAMCLGELALAGVCGGSLLALRRAQRSQEAALDCARKLLPNNAGLSSAATVEQGVARVGEVWAAGDAHLRNERDGFKSILAAMSEGILVVDSSRCVLFSNPAARKILGIAEDSLLAQSLLQLTQQAELLANIDMSIVAMQACSFEFNLTDEPGAPKRYIQAHCAPYKSERQPLSGAVAVLHDITELRRLERMRSEFVSNVSHELRTPLTSLIGYLETLQLSGAESPEERAEFLAICVRQAENLNRIVEDLLRLSRLENPQSEIADAQVSLNEVVRSAVEQSSFIATKRGIALTCETPEQEARIVGDRGLLVQAVGNLIENAIHYNREHGSVTVKLSAVKRGNGIGHGNGNGHGDALDDDFEWQIAVADTGIGIPQDALQRVFERFYRVDKARSRSQGGTGLGLAIVKHIALAHGASVHVESEVGKGTTFLIRLKARKPRSERMTAKK